MLIQVIERPVLYFVVLTTLFLGIVVFLRDRRNHSNLLFSLLSFNFSAWALVNHFSVSPPFFSVLVWARLVMFFAAPQAVLFALFIHTYPGDKIQIKGRYIFLILIAIFVEMGLCLSSLVFSEITIVAGKAVPTVGPAIAYFGLVTAVSFLIGIYFLIKKTFAANGEARKGLLIILTGFSLMAVLLLTFLLFAVTVLKNTSFVPISPLFVLPFIIATGHSLTRSSFLNIKLIATEFFVAFLVIILLVEALLSDSFLALLFKSTFSFFVGILGYLLVGSVYKEVHQREQLQAITKELQVANSKLKELDQQKTDFLSIAAHQLRTPMSIMNGYIELIKDDAYGKVTQETKDVLDNMDSSNQHLIKLVDEFLDITRIEQGRTKFDFEECDVNALIDGVVQEQSQRAKEKGVKVAWKKPKEKLLANLDEEKIRHVVYNFLDNALKYSEKGTITIKAEIEDNGIKVAVDDQGFGFNKTDENNFFQKFYRGENVKHTHVSGTGLGLFVCRRFIEAHKGKIWAHSDGLGKGSEFGFWVPNSL